MRCETVLERTRSQAKELLQAAMRTLVVSMCLFLPLHRHSDAPLISRILAEVNGPLLIAAVRSGASDEVLLAISPGRDPHVLIPHLPLGTGIGASPRGRYIALAEGRQGLWLSKSDGTGLSRRLLPPLPTQQLYPLAIKAVAWSPDRYTLAYVVGEDISSAKGPGQPGFASDTHVGVWVVRYDGGTPRQVAHGDFGRAGTPAASLSWSSEGRTIVAVGHAGVTAIDAATGRARVLAAQDTSDGSVQVAAATSTTAAVCYIRLLVGSQAIAYTLYVADADGRHARRLLQISNTITSPAWAPDGRSIAYLWQHGPTEGGYRSPVEIHAVDVASGRTRVLLGPRASNHGAIQSFTWLPIRS